MHRYAYSPVCRYVSTTLYLIMLISIIEYISSSLTSAAKSSLVSEDFATAGIPTYGVPLYEHLISPIEVDLEIRSIMSGGGGAVEGLTIAPLDLPMTTLFLRVARLPRRQNSTKFNEIRPTNPATDPSAKARS